MTAKFSRIRKARIKLNLTHWDPIEEWYDLKASSSVKEALTKLKLEDPISYDNKYSLRKQRYTDFDLSWTRRKYEEGVYGVLVARGKLRFKGLNSIDEGCEAIIT